MEKNKGGRPIGTYEYTPEQLLKEADEYFKYCETNYIRNDKGEQVQKPKTVSGLRKWLRVSKNWISQKAKNDAFMGMIANIYDEIENDVEEGAMVGRWNPTIASKNLSANFDWREKTDNLNNNANADVSDVLSPEQKKLIAQRFNG